MKLFAFFLALVISQLISFSAQASEIAQCEYYPQKARALGCGKDNYLMKFGYRYCRSFETRHTKFSADAQPVLDKIRTCLILEMEKRQPVCLTAEAHGFNSHVPCYLLNGYCGLSGSDKLHILWIVRDQVANKNFRKVSSVINRACNTGRYP
ncbi:MAG: hypothetical protein V4760_03325 [Bdellovibrionota bacterium]